MKIALTHSTLASYFTRPEDPGYKNNIRTILKRVRKTGYEAVEMGRPEGFSSEEFRDMADEVGIKILTAGALSYTELKGYDFSEWIKECKILGAPNIMVSNIDKLVLGNYDELKKFIRCLSRAGKAFREEGIFLSYHNHAVDFTKINGKTIFDHILDGTDPDYVKIECDTYWIQAGGGHVISWLKKLKDRIFVIRLKDYAIDQYSDHTFLECTHRRFAEVGEGNLNWPGILEECLQQGIEWGTVEQDQTQKPAYESIAISYRNLMGLGALNSA